MVSKESRNMTKFKCELCNQVFDESEFVEIYYKEYEGARAWPESVTPCYHSVNFTELEE
jgi:hypothetical protein